MNAGIISILTHQSPYQFRGLQIISTIFFLLDLSLFLFFSLLFIARFIWFRWAAYHEIVGSMVDLTLVACWSISWLTLTSLVSLTVSNASWGHSFSTVGYVMWWIGAAWNLVVLFWVFITLIRRHDAADRRLPTTIFIPAVSVSTVAVTGGLVATQAHAISARAAVPVIIVSFLYVGVGIFFGLILSTYLLHSLLAQGWPPPPQIATMFIFVGPFGQSSAALQLLSSAARVNGEFGAYHKGTFLTAEAAPALEAACVMFALLMTGLDIVLLFLAMYAMIECAVQRKLVWAPNWNSIIFPTGTLATSTLRFGVEMDSPAWRVVSAILIIFLVVVFLLNLGFTITRIWQGRLLVVREDPRVKEKMEMWQKER